MVVLLVAVPVAGARWSVNNKQLTMNNKQLTINNSGKNKSSRSGLTHLQWYFSRLGRAIAKPNSTKLCWACPERSRRVSLRKPNLQSIALVAGARWSVTSDQ